VTFAAPTGRHATLSGVELAEAVRRRRMVRSYDPARPVAAETVRNLLSLAIRAPSAGHTQGWEFLVLNDITSRTIFWNATAEGEPDAWRSRMQTAPVLIVCFSNKQAYLDRYAEPDKNWGDRDEHRWPVPYWHIDTGMAAMILLLAAEDAGLAACLFGVPGARWDTLRAAFAVPGQLEPVCVISLGYAAPDQRSPSLRRGRRSLDDVLHIGSFSNSAGSVAGAD
jgi:nitroreductase